jgi:hypothetical protein
MLQASAWNVVPASAAGRIDDRSAGAAGALADALSEALSRGTDSDSLTLASQGLENDALDRVLSRPRTAASLVLLRTIAKPKLLQDLRTALRRNMTDASSSKALSLLARWQGLVEDDAKRGSLLAGLSGAADLGSSMGGTASPGPQSAMAGSGSPSSAVQPGSCSRLDHDFRLTKVLEKDTDASSPYKPVHSGLSPPGRSPPSFLSAPNRPSQKPRKPSLRSKPDQNQETAVSPHPLSKRETLVEPQCPPARRTL